MPSVEEEILLRIPEPDPEPWQDEIRQALRDLGEGHGQEWLAWKIRRPLATVSRWLRGYKAPHDQVNAIRRAVREEAEAHLSGNCSKASFLSRPQPPEVIHPFVHHQEPLPLPVAV